MAQGSDIAKAVSIIMPIASAFIQLAEESGASGEQKHAAVSSQLEKTYTNLQNTRAIKELNEIPWELVAPLVVPIGTGLISAIVEIFNQVGRFFKGVFSSEE